MKTLIVLAAIAALIMVGCARVPWTKTDKAMYFAAVAAQGFDYYTTKRDQDIGRKISHEWQWLYGSDRPSSGTLAVSKTVQLGIAWCVLDRTPSKLRKVMLGILTGTLTFFGSQNRKNRRRTKP